MKSALPRALFFVLALRKLLGWRGASELGVHGLLGAISRG
jgi:hypothetical protein